MPRLSLYRPEKGNDYKFIDRQASEMFQVGGTDLYVHKYLGPANPADANATADQPQYDAVKETNIQDLLFLENRDRKYDPDIYRVRCVYNVADIDFNLSQFGLFIDNDTLYMTVHINDFIKTVGRKPLSGDVLEIPHLRDEFALNDADVSLPRYYVISDVGRAAEGFSPTWYPHLYRLKLTKISDSQQYKEIFDQKIVDPITGEETDNTLRDLLSTQQRALDINDALIAQAESDAPKSGYETQHFYTLSVDEKGNPALETVDDSAAPPDAGSTGVDVGRVQRRPKRDGYQGYLLGDGIAPNGVDFGHGITFPSNAYDGDFFLRTDFLPNRLFRFDGSRWIKYEDAVRTSMTPSNNRNTLKGTFINNTGKTGVGFITSDVIKPVIITTTVQTNETFVAGMFATVTSETVDTKVLSVTAGTGGKALITFTEAVPVGSQVEWKLYTSSRDERVAVSKALKPRADL
jgi:hypothetical protein